MKRQHPLKILTYSAKNLWLLIFPLVRGLLSVRLGDVEAFVDWFSGAWFDILTLLVILLMGYVRWSFSRFNVVDGRIVFLNGVLVRTRTVIPIGNVSSVTEEHSFYLRPVRATRVLVNTRAGNLSSDVTLMVTEQTLHWLRRAIGSDDTTTDRSKCFEYRPHFWHTFFFSFVFSSTLSGAVYILVFLFKAGSILEQLLERSVLDEFNLVSETIANRLMLKVSPIFVGLAVLVGFSWVLSFVTNIVRYTNFHIKKDSHGVFVRTGVVTKRRYKICENMVNYVDLCQSLLTKVFRYVSINVDCSGYGTNNEEIPVFIPIMSYSNCQGTVSAIMPTVKLYPNDYRPRLTNLWRYTYTAIVPSALVVVAYCVGVHYLPSAKSIVRFVTVMLEVPLVWYLVVCTVSLCTTGFSLKDNQLCIRYSRGYTFHTILVSDAKLAKVTITQTVFQRLSDTYNVVFYLTTEQSKGHRVMGVPRSAVEPFMSVEERS